MLQEQNVVLWTDCLSITRHKTSAARQVDCVVKL